MQVVCGESLPWLVGGKKRFLTPLLAPLLAPCWPDTFVGPRRCRVLQGLALLACG